VLCTASATSRSSYLLLFAMASSGPSSPRSIGSFQILDDLESDDLVPSSEALDSASIATTENESWILLDDGASEDERQAEHERTIAACEATFPFALPASAAADLASSTGVEALPQPEEEEPQPQQPLYLDEVPSAKLLSTWQLDLGMGGGLLFERPGHYRDCTSQWHSAFQEFPGVTGAFCFGRVSVSAPEGSAALVAIARAYVRNSGPCPWPASTTLRLVAGHGWGFHELEVGPLGPGQDAELVLDLNCSHGHGLRSGWILEDGTNRPFGPLLVLEVEGHA